MYCFIHSQKKVIMDFCTINSTQSCFFSKLKNPGRCFVSLSEDSLVFWTFSSCFFKKHWPHGTIFRKRRESDAQHQQKHSFRGNRQVCTAFPRHPSEYILRWVGVLGCMFFWVQILNLRSCFWMSRVLNRIFVAKRSSKTTLDAERNFGSPLLKAA